MAQTNQSARKSTASVEKKIEERKKEEKKENKTSSPTSKTSNTKTRKKKTDSNKVKKLKIGKFSISITYLYVLIGIVSIFFIIGAYGMFFSQYRKPVNRMFKDISAHKEYSDSFAKDITSILKKADKDKEEVKNVLNMYSDFYEDNMEDIEYELLAKSKIRKDNLKQVEKEVNEFVKNNGDDKEKEINISEGYIMAVRISYKIDDKEYDTYRVISVYKMNGSWGIWYSK